MSEFEAASGSAEEFLPLERYALIGDAGTAALVSDDGSIDWLCLPRFDSDPVFARVLDPGAGHFSLRPSVPFTLSRSYVPGTAVVTTTYTTASGRAAVDDFFVAQEGSAKRRGLTPFRPLIRRIRGRSGSVPFIVEVAPRDAFGGGMYRLRSHGTTLSADLAGRSLLIFGPCGWTIEGASVATARVDVAAGDTVIFSMSFAGRDIGVLPYGPRLADVMFEETVDFWRRWSSLARRSGGAEVERSAIVLKLLTFAPSGGIVAAPTTSLPETPRGERNWDYRYVWVRDASWTAEALTSLGYEDEAGAYLTWAINAMRTSRPNIHTLYTLYGNSSVVEREIRGLRGYGDARPVRKGNAAVDQRQLDNWGHVVDMAYSVARRQDGLDRETWDGVSSLVRFVAERWRERDQGMWEVRSEPRHFVHSKVMAWVALDRGVQLAREFHLRGDIDGWERERDAVKSAVLEHGIDPATGAFRQAFGTSDADAALLLIGSTRFLPSSDERVRRTIDVVRNRLERDGLVHRYRGVDGLDGDEGAFVACSFWLAQALALAGRRREAEQVFTAMCERSNDVGLLPEEIDPQTDAYLGNMPQALSHMALINAATAIDGAPRNAV
ncbi:MAG: glycoside hydrolase family 15 protein [Actinomycetota bacterium]